MCGTQSAKRYQMTQDLQPDYFPLTHYLMPDEASHERGKALLGQGKVGAIALAGGHGSRLGFHAPKGCYPISKVFKKSLYQLLAEKTLAASRESGQALKLAIMTSDATHVETVLHFQQADFFGLKKEQLSFFQQQNLPLTDDNGHEVIGPDSKPITAPNGNGAMFWDFAASGLLDIWQKSGIEQIVVFTIDNALADPFQPHLIGVNEKHQNDATVVGIERITHDEQVGVLVERAGRLAVIEYSEMQESERFAQDAAGSFKHRLANISYFVFSLEFIKAVLTHPVTELPLHKAKKKIFIAGSDLYFWKSEYFIFDVLNLATRAEVLLLDRQDYFAPLKNKEGKQSIASTQAALEAFDRRKYHALTGKWPPVDRPFELSNLNNDNVRIP